MKKNLSITIAILCVVLFFVGYFIFNQQIKKNNEMTSAEITDYIEESNRSMKEMQEHSEKIMQTEEFKLFENKRTKQLKTILDVQSKYITFYGKVLDQNGRPVVNAQVIYTAAALGDATGRATTMTNSNGIFLIGEARGARLDINEVIVPGYQVDIPMFTSFFSYKETSKALLWTDHVTPETAYVFESWKIEGGYPKINKGELLGAMFEPDGRTYTWNLLEGNQGRFRKGEQEGDMSVSFYRDESIWKVVLTAHEGGFIETDDKYLNLAPESGYQASISYEGLASDYQLEKTLYFTSRNQEVYGWINIRIRPKYRDKSAIHLKYVVNIENGRSLVVKPD